MTRGKVNAFELRGSENPVSASQSDQKVFVFELSNDSLIGQSAARLSNRKHSLSFEPLYFYLMMEGRKGDRCNANVEENETSL